MPATLSTTVKHIYDKVPNPVNSELIAEFHEYMKDNGASQRHQNNNLKAIIVYADFLGPEKTFYQVKSKDEITCFLDTKMKNDLLDPEKRWITTWNDYLVRIKKTKVLYSLRRNLIHTAYATHRSRMIQIICLNTHLRKRQDGQ